MEVWSDVGTALSPGHLQYEAVLLASPEPREIHSSGDPFTLLGSDTDSALNGSQVLDAGQPVALQRKSQALCSALDPHSRIHAGRWF